MWHLVNKKLDLLWSNKEILQAKDHTNIYYLNRIIDNQIIEERMREHQKNIPIEKNNSSSIILDCSNTHK